MTWLIKDDGCEQIKVEYDGACGNELFREMINWCVEHDAYDGEVIWQSDSIMEAAPELLTKIAEEVFKFKVTYDYTKGEA